MRYYPIPLWFQKDSTHKAVFVGPDGMKVPACKMYHRDQWPNDGCWEPADISKRNWKDVTCCVCRTIPNYGPEFLAEQCIPPAEIIQK